MDEDDSPDELIRRGVHKKRTAPWNISDSDDDIDGSEEGESESSDEDEEDDNDEDDDLEGEDNEEEDDEDEEDDTKVEDGVLGEPSASISAMNSDEDADKCPICLNTFSSQPVATPENCEHYFCLDCILAWSKNANSCPVDRITFNSIYLRKSYGGKVQKMITVQKPVTEDEEVIVDLDLEQTNCEVCQGSDREDRLLLCDGCDAGYHMECLTPPLDTVPVEEWFCPECVANNSGSAEEQNQTQRLPSTAQPTTSRSHSRAAVQTRAIARTQHSERVRANVNRHRISQARTSQLAPTDQIQSNWLDETINAVVAGLNTSVYIRDLTPCARTGRRRKSGTRRKATKKKALSVKGKKGRSTKARRKRKGRRTKSKRTLVGKKLVTPRSRIANSLGLSKDKNNGSLPTVCRPSEHTLSSMRADIGAASLSIYGDPSDLDPFVEREEDEQEEAVSSLLEAKRRGISHSAFRSHQPVARPVSTGMSRRGLDVSQTGGIVEAAPVPDLLGSILSGQSMLLMDSSDVVIGRDGYLKASQSANLSTLRPGLRERSSSEESSGLAQPVDSASLGECSSSTYNRHGPRPSHSNFDRPLSQCSSPVPSDVSHIQPPHHPDLSSRGNLGFQPPLKNRPSPSFGVQRTNGASICGAPSSCRGSDPSSYSKTPLPKQCQPIKAPTKPMWLDVDILPRIPKIKRDATNDGSSGNSNSSSSINNSGMPETALVSFAGDKNEQQHVAQQSNPDRQPQNQGAGSSQAFANSFSNSSSAVSPSASLCNSTVSSSSISFRINISRNSFHSRRIFIPSSSASGSSTQAERKEKIDEMRKRQEHRDKQKVLASRTAAGNKKDVNVYDPFNPTMSDASSSDSEAESLASSFHRFNSVPSSAFIHDVEQSKQKQLRVQTESQSEVAQEEPRSANLQISSRVGSCTRVVKVENESIVVKTENQAAQCGMELKRQTGLFDSGKDSMFGLGVRSCSGSETRVTFSPVQHNLDYFKMEEESEQCATSAKNVPQDKNIDSFMKVRLNEEVKSDLRSSPRDLSHEKKTSTPAVSSKQQQKTKDHLVSKQGDRQKKMDKDRERRSRSRERRTRSSSESSQSSSPKRTGKKRQRRSSSSSSSSSRERSRRRKYDDSSQERFKGSRSGRKKRKRSKDRKRRRSRSRSRSRGRAKDHRRGRSRSTSPSTSPYRSRSKERRKERTYSRYEDVKARPKDKRRPRSRSSSRERRKVDASSKSLTKTSVSCFSSSKYHKDSEKESRVSPSSVKEEQIPVVQKYVSKSPLVAKVTTEDNGAEPMAISIGIKKEITIGKKVKKNEQPSIDMFEHSPTPPHTKAEDTPSTSQEIKKEPIKIEECKTIEMEETFEITPIKAESVSSELPVTSPHTSDGQQESPTHFQPNGKAPVDQASTTELNAPMKQAPESDDDFSVEMLLDSLDFVKQVYTEDIGADVKQEDIQQEGGTQAEQPLTPSKVKIQGKRVTWNIQEPNGAQPDKCPSIPALCEKMQEDTHTPPAIPTSQDTSGPGSVSDSPKRVDIPLPTGSGCPVYLKKLHMQERAIEEVKLAIKPFYQQRDINKEEYKAILRKAVQKVCHSKSGEINPVKVGNLIKAYVNKYKHARKHH